MYEGTSYCGVESIPRPAENEWVTTVLRWQQSTNTVSLESSHLSTQFSKVCSLTFQNRVLNTYIGRNLWWTNQWFSGDIAGLYAFDRYLSYAEAKTVADGIVIDTAFLGARLSANTVAPGNDLLDTSILNVSIVALDDTWFDRARKDYVDYGTKTWNIATNGGFTAVLKWRFTISPLKY